MTEKYLVRMVQAELIQAGRYPRLESALEKMDRFALEDLLRLVRDLSSKVVSEQSKRKRGQFWG